MLAKLVNSAKIVGTKQTLKALEAGGVEVVYVAEDAKPAIVGPVKEQCRELGVTLVTVESMAELGRACQIHVGAAVACVLK